MILWQGVESINAFWLSRKQKYAILCEDNVSCNAVSKIFSRDDVETIVGSGWKFVTTRIDEFSETCAKKNKLMLGFIDRDYWHFRDEFNLLANKKLVYTDLRDIEIDLLESKAFIDFLQEKKPALSAKADDIRNSIYNNLYAIGKIRVYNHIYQKEWDFPDVIDYIEKNTFNYSKWETRFRQINKIKTIDYTKFKEWEEAKIFNPKEIIRGHDAVMILYELLGIQYVKPKTKNAIVITIEDCLSLCITKDFISQFSWARLINSLLK